MGLKMYEEKKGPERLEPSRKIAHIIGIAAGKGGVGKSTVAVQIARALQQMGHSVGVLDADVYGPSIRRMMPEDTPPAQKGSVISPALSQGIRTISMGYFRQQGEALAVRAPVANSVIRQFLSQVDWGYLDYLLIDFPPGTGDVQLTLCQHARLTGALLVTTPQEVALQDVRKAAHLFMQLQIPLLGIVENMSYYKEPTTDHKSYLFGQGGGERLSSEWGIPLLGEIPIDPYISVCGDNGCSIYSTSGSKSAQEAFSSCAKSLLKEISCIESQEGEGINSVSLTWREM